GPSSSSSLSSSSPGLLPCFKVKVALVIVEGSIASLKMTAIFPLMATPVAALAGTVALTVGAVVSGVEPVVAAPGATGACPAAVKLLIVGGGCVLTLEGVALVGVAAGGDWVVGGARAFPGVCLMCGLR